MSKMGFEPRVIKRLKFIFSSVNKTFATWLRMQSWALVYDEDSLCGVPNRCQRVTLKSLAQKGTACHKQWRWPWHGVK